LTYLVRARYDDGAMELEDLEWRMLVRLAHRYGWQTEEDLDHYIHEPPEVLPESTSQALAEALEKAVECLPVEGSSTDQGDIETTGTLLYSPGQDPQSYFGGGGRMIVGEFVGLCRQGELEVSESTK
jgi:hypothetical protein